MNALIGKMVAMSDGVRLATDVWLPQGAGPFPTILMRTPYHRQNGVAREYVDQGYAFVVQDCRGKYDSEGVFTPLADEARDGQDTVDWIANQKWCNGRIGMVGASYLGFVQVPAASGGHEALRCIVPQLCSATFFRQWARYDGCPSLANALIWNLTHAVCRTRPSQLHFDWQELHHLGTLEEIYATAKTDRRLEEAFLRLTEES